MKPAGNLLVDVCWGAWAAVWFAGWLYNLARGPRTRRRYWEWPATAIGVGCWLLLRHGPHVLLTAAAWRGAWAAYAGGAVLVAATAFTLWARIVLGRMWSSAPSVKEGHQLRTGGPYAVTRHPIYTGMLGMLLGTVVVWGRWWAVVALIVVTAYMLQKVRVEERFMSETFGERYAEYRRRTPQIVPRLRRAGRP